jgi:hypothetical protein
MNNVVHVAVCLPWLATRTQLPVLLLAGSDGGTDPLGDAVPKEAPRMFAPRLRHPHPAQNFVTTPKYQILCRVCCFIP